MCLAIPGRVVECVSEQPLLVKVEVGGVRRNVDAGLFLPGEIGIGDWVLVHVGFVLSKISETEAEEQLQLLAALGEEMLALDEMRGYAFAETPM